MIRDKKTSYTLGVSYRDMIEATDFLEGQGITGRQLGKPMVLARREGKVVGIVATQPDNKDIIAGPMAVNVEEGANTYVLMRMVEAYENVLMLARVSGYYFAIALNEESWLNIIRKTGLFTDLGPNESLEYQWFRKDFTYDR